jgi:hypothetical protein
MRWYADPATRAFIALRYLPWLAALSLAWEIAQLPLYTLWHEAEPAYIAFAVAHCTIGDVLIGGAIDVAGFKLGLSPLAQWLVVPPLALYLSTRSAGRRFGMNRE